MFTFEQPGPDSKSGGKPSQAGSSCMEARHQGPRKQHGVPGEKHRDRSFLFNGGGHSG